MNPADPRIETLLSLVAQAPDGVGVSDLEPQLNPPVPRRTLQLWLGDLVAQKRLKARGAGKATRYFTPKVAPVITAGAVVAGAGAPGRNGPASASPRPAQVQPVARVSPSQQTAAGDGRAPSQSASARQTPYNQPASAPVLRRRAEEVRQTPSSPLPGSPNPATTEPATDEPGGESGAETAVEPGDETAPETTPDRAGEALESADSEPADAYDPRFAPVFRRYLPEVVKLCRRRGAAEEDLIVEGVRLFHDDSDTIRTMAAQGLDILDALTEEDAVAWGVKPHDYQLWRRYWS